MIVYPCCCFSGKEAFFSRTSLFIFSLSSSKENNSGGGYSSLNLLHGSAEALAVSHDSCVKWGKTSMHPNSHFCTSDPTPNCLCSLWGTIMWSSEPWAAYLAFIVSPALILTAENGQTRYTSSFLEKLKLWEPVVLLSSSAVTAESLCKATFPQGLSDCWALGRYAESTAGILLVHQAHWDNFYLWHASCHLLLISRTTPNKLLQKPTAFLKAGFVKAEQILFFI